MKIWVRSQDKTDLIKAERIRLSGSGLSILVNGYIFGTYETEKRALKILDEIQKIIKWCQEDMKNVTIGDMNNLKGCFDDCVYEMPSE